MSQRDPHNAYAQAFESTWNVSERYFAHIIIFYQRHDLTPIYKLIVIGKAQGYAWHLRAGQAMERLILSRSREARLQPGQPMIHVDATGTGHFRVTYADGRQQAHVVSDALTVADTIIVPDVKVLLDQLAAHPIA